MRWRWRKREAEPSHDQGPTSLELAATSQYEALTKLEESFEVRAKVEQQKETGSNIAQTLARIRAENHFQEIWNEGLRG